MRSTCPYHDRCILDANTSSHIAGGRGRSLTGRHHKWAGQVSHRQASQVGGAGVSGRHRRWVGQVSHGQASSQVGGAGLSRAGIIASGRGRAHRQASQAGGAGLSQAGIITGGWGRHHSRWVGQVSHRQAFRQILINLRVTYKYIYIYKFGMIVHSQCNYQCSP